MMGIPFLGFSFLEGKENFDRDMKISLGIFHLCADGVTKSSPGKLFLFFFFWLDG